VSIAYEGPERYVEGDDKIGIQARSALQTPALDDILEIHPAERALTVLGIETSCDETAAAVVRRGAGPSQSVQVLSSVVTSQIADHAPYGGVVPEVAARAHVEIIDDIIAKAMREAGVAFAELDGVAATAGPGLVGGVMVGLSAGKAIALARGLPLVAVNHLEGHAVSARLGADTPYPFLLLLVSGGHCQLLTVDGVGACTRLGTTIDDAAGEAFDKIAAHLGLPYPGGPALERLAASGRADRFVLPRMLLGRPGCDFSFSGLKTAAARLADAEITTDQDRADLAATVQAAISSQLAERTRRAMALYAADHAAGELRFVVAGGVAANGAVRAALTAAAAEHGFSLAAPPLAYCTDNAAMIALAGLERLALGLIDGLDAPARPRWPLDEEAAIARPMHAAGRKGAKA
jgi:N6-L-threonylcarbamoyladenine synthase